MSWQPIETAPRNAAPVILGWDDGDHLPCMGNYRPTEKRWRADREDQWGGARHMKQNPPTHWMPFPDSPEPPHD